MEFDHVLALRKSVRRYTEEAVSVEQEEALLHAAMASSVGKHNDRGYVLAVVRDKEILQLIARETAEKTGGGDPLFRAPFLLLICRTKEAVEYLMEFDAGIIAEHVHLKAAELGLGSVILRGFIRNLGEDAEYVRALKLPEGVYPLLGVAVGHGPGSDMLRKEDRKFEVIRIG